MADEITSLGNMAVDKISPTDPRVKKASTEVGGRRWCELIPPFSVLLCRTFEADIVRQTTGTLLRRENRKAPCSSSMASRISRWHGDIRFRC